jgi:AcrR family transcriptional regulator
MRTRLTAAERGEQVLDAAVAAFARGGFAGTRTDEIARRAGVTQPYVIRLFGTKQRLFLAALARVCDRVEQIFRDAAAATPTLDALGDAYSEFLADSDLLTLMLQGFAASADPVVGDVMRERYGRIYRLVGELTGAPAVEVRQFLANGMLLTILGAMKVVGPQPVFAPWAQEILATFEL